MLGRALLDQERDDEAMGEFVKAEWLFETLGSSSHVAAAWLAQGDAYSRKGDLDASAALYRRAAEVAPGLQLLGRRHSMKKHINLVAVML